VINEQKVLEKVHEIRMERPKTGTEKLYTELKPNFIEMNIKIGRDKLHDLLKFNGLLVKKTKRYHITTDSKHGFFKSPNRIKEPEITRAEQVFAADITYIHTDQGHTYLALVTDLYSKKIMGWSYADNMKAELVIDALKMAKKNCVHAQKEIIHHSDRGIQYCCPAFSGYAENNGFILSTTQQYDPYENAVAERINGILKYEFGLKDTIANLEMAHKMIAQAVKIYNEKRLHWSLDFKTPNEVHKGYNQINYVSYKKKKTAVVEKTHA
jgi:transposase InsO family protein